MKFFYRLFFTAFFFFPLITFSQQKDTLIKKLDSLSRKTDSAGRQINNTSPAAYNENTKLTFNSYFTLLGSDLKQEFTKPFHMTKKDWRNFAFFAAPTFALGFADKSIQKSAVKFTSNKTGVQRTSSYITKFGGIYEMYTLATLGAYGIVFKNQKLKTTTLLATQAYITGGALESVLKYLSGRTRPSFYDANSIARPKFLGPSSKTTKDANGKKVYSSFPSGHTTVAFAAATVFASEYSNYIIVPIIAYSFSTLVALSRITENKHWTTDVVVGAAIGYLAGKNVVNNYHRYAKLKAPNQKKNSVSFNLNIINDQLVPGLVYKFK